MNTRYVYFDKDGVITDILKVRKQGRAKYVIAPLDDVLPLLSGKRGMFDFVVSYDYDKEKYVLLERDNIIKLRYYGEKLYKIPNRIIDDYDLRIDFFTEENIIEVSIDPSRMSTMYATDLTEEVKFEEGTDIRIYIKNKNGDELFQTIIIDAQKLLEKGQLLFKVDKKIEQNNVSFYTERYFENYMWRKGSAKFLSPIKDQIRFEVQRADYKRKHGNFEYHLIVQKDPSGIKIINNIENIKLVKLFNEVEFYIVDRYDPSILYFKFVLSPKQLKSKEIIIKTDEDISNKRLLYNHKYISVLMEG